MKITPQQVRALGLSDKAIIRHLPHKLAEIARIAGVEAAIQIGCRFGGSMFYIPEKLTEDTVLVQTVGMDAAKKLSVALADGFGITYRLPASLGRVVRRLTAVKLLKSGHSLTQAAQETGLCRSTVQKLREDFQNHPL